MKNTFKVFLFFSLYLLISQSAFGQWMRTSVNKKTVLKDHRTTNSPILLHLEKDRDVLSLPLNEENEYIRVWDYLTGKRGYVNKKHLTIIDTLAKAELKVPPVEHKLHRDGAILKIENIEDDNVIVEIDKIPYSIAPYAETKLILKKGYHGFWAYRDGALPFWGSIFLHDSTEHILKIETTAEKDVIIADIEPIIHRKDTVVVESHFKDVVKLLPKIKMDSSKIVDNTHPQDLAKPVNNVDIRGYIKLNGLYDFNGLTSTGGFVPYKIPVGEKNVENRGFYMGARQSRLGFFSRIKTDEGYIKFYVEADFAGGSVSYDYFRLRQAYVQYGYLTVGQTWTTFTDLYSTPLTVDNEGPSSSSSTRQGLIRFEKKVGNSNNEFAVSLETPTKNFGDTIAIDSRQLFPDVASRYKIEYATGQLQFAGLFRVLSQHNIFDDVITKVGYGLMVSGKNSTTNEKHKFYYQAIGGRGITRYISAFSSYNLDAVPSPTKDIYIPFTLGGYITYEYYFHKNLFINFVTGFSWIDNSAWQPGSTFERSYYTSANMFWFPFDRMRVGGSFVQGARVNKDQQRGDASRFQMYIRYDI
ncbi:DcaP family trimeric outer membrane transporter [Flammeovirga kamogawensis]|uniref:Porin n=1 Tax=Flammeovirga kamogawensis TaxID=373891 RepID=A0ABX8GQR7_9BACT|nr:DcaP family trimeric outer membrane transporter [Flammeovirga kamogawensis]MBB6463447.1 hypothetical protein [Flammeovirga kamogawensis]QWG05627.1 porin [Flammeovirga kamogawensis]